MTRERAVAALETGIALAGEVLDGAGVLAIGEMASATRRRRGALLRARRRDAGDGVRPRHGSR